jgi:hypothetical protein
MPAPIKQYHVADFGSVKAASAGAAALLEYVTTGKGLRHMTGPRRAVMWGAGPTAPALSQGSLYLSDGALEAAGELRLAFTPGDTLPAEQLPAFCTLLLGDPSA